MPARQGIAPARARCGQASAAVGRLGVGPGQIRRRPPRSSGGGGPAGRGSVGGGGYSVGDFDQCMADLSVDHAYVAEDYRTAREISARAERGGASTEDLRQAMIFYRTLFEDVLGERIRKQEAHHERAA